VRDAKASRILFFRHKDAKKTGPVFRKDLIALLGAEPRSVSSIAREMGLRRGDVEDDLRHAIRSARARGAHVTIIPASCRSCGFVFSEEKLSKPGKCPGCRGSRLLEAQISIGPLPFRS
jgi:transcriptional regulator